ncbi:MAG TPA: O-antigen ligase family protein [Melioribacteraceae bacterium]|nr:O-antigen ligase family protein [Melioribacteraceae bacterium]
MNSLKYLSKYWNNLYFIPIAMGLIATNLIPAYIILVLLSIFAFVYGEEYFLGYIIVTFLLFASSENTSLRLVIQITNLLLLAYLFLKNYGLDTKKYIKIPNYIIALVCSYFAIMFFSIIFSKYKALGIEQAIRSIQFFTFIYLFYAIFNYYKNINHIIIAFYVVSGFFSVLLTYQFLFTDFSLLLVNSEYLVKLSEFYVHKNTISLFFTNIILISFALLYYDNQKKYKILLKLIIFFFFLGLIITNSRSSLMVSIVGILFLAYYLNKKIIKYIGISAIIIILISFLPPINEFIILYLRIEQISAGRDIIYASVLKAIPHIWLTGAGPAASQYYMFDYFPFQMGSPEQLFWDYYSKHRDFGHPHNFYLFYFADLGILGLLFSFFLPGVFLTLGFKSIKFYKNLKDNYKYLLSLSITAIGIAYFIRGLFEWGGILSYGFMSIDLPFWILFIVLMYLYSETKNTINFD